MDGLALRESAILVNGGRKVSLEERKTEVVRKPERGRLHPPIRSPGAGGGSAAPSHDRTTTGNCDA